MTLEMLEKDIWRLWNGLTICKLRAMKDAPYIWIPRPVVDFTLSNLSSAGIKLWLYFMSQPDGSVIRHTSDTIEKEIHMPLKEYCDALYELVQKNYIVECKELNELEFWETPLETIEEDLHVSPADFVSDEQLEEDEFLFRSYLISKKNK